MNYKNRKFSVQYSAQFISKTKNNELRIWLAKPVDNTYQKIDKFIISPNPNCSYKDEQGNEILYFNFKNFQKINLNFKVLVDLSQKKSNLQYEKQVPLEDKKLKRFLKNENFLEQTLDVKSKTVAITQDQKSLYEKIKKTFNFVADNFEYCYPVKKRGVKNLKLNQLRGDCGEYSSLLVTMLRILDIPSRDQTGFVIFPAENEIAEHGWASVYIKPFGWVDFDAQYASLDKKDKKTGQKYFGQRSDFRINFTNGFNIPLKPQIPVNFQAEYWQKIDSPFSNNSVQTLQPIFFVSKEKVDFKKNIKLV